MNFIYAFLFAGFACVIAEVILDNTKLTPGHITSLFTVIGSILSCFGAYDWLIKKCGAGATVLISNFGHNLYQAGLEGFNNSGILGLFSNLLTKSSVALVGAIVCAFLISIFFKPKN